MVENRAVLGSRIFVVSLECLQLVFTTDLMSDIQPKTHKNNHRRRDEGTGGAKMPTHVWVLGLIQAALYSMCTVLDGCQQCLSARLEELLLEGSSVCFLSTCSCRAFSASLHAPLSSPLHRGLCGGGQHSCISGTGLQSRLSPRSAGILPLWWEPSMDHC